MIGNMFMLWRGVIHFIDKTVVLYKAMPWPIMLSLHPSFYLVCIETAVLHVVCHILNAFYRRLLPRRDAYNLEWGHDIIFCILPHTPTYIVMYSL